MMRLTLPAVALAIASLVLPASPATAQQPQPAQTRPAPPESVPNPRIPELSRDGSMIAFTWHGDIWTIPAAGGRATRVTMHEAYESTPVFSPNGQKIAFASNRNHGYDIYVVDTEGGTPERITYDAGVDIPLQWMDDGENLLMLSTRSGNIDLWRLPLAGGTPQRLTLFGARDGCVSPDGKWLVFTRANGTNDAFQARYTGSSNHDLFVQSLEPSDAPAIPQPLTQTDWNEFDPHFTADGQYVIYRAEEGDVFNIYRVKVDGSEAPQKLTNFPEGKGVDRLHYCADQNTAVFQRDFRLWSLKLEDGAEAVTPGITVVEDETAPRLIDRLVTKGSVQGDAQGDRLVFELEGDIWYTPLAGGIARKIVATELKDEWPRLAPNGQMIAFQVNNGGNTDIYVRDLRDGRLTRLTNAPKLDAYFNWSPDSSKIVFCSDRSGDREIWVLDVANPNEVKQLTNQRGSDDDPVFTADGQHIVFDSERGGTQDIWIMGADGSNPRKLFGGQAFEQVARVSPDGKWVVYESVNQEARETTIMFGSINGGPSMAVGQGSAPFFTPDSAYIVFEVDGVLSRVKTPSEVAVPEAIPMVAHIQKPEQQQYKETFEEAWSALKQGFYDPGFHGVDWDAIKREYAPVIAQATNREEMANLLSRAIGQLGASHMGYYAQSEYSSPRVPTGRIGATTQLVQTPNGAMLKIIDVTPGGPAHKAWIRPGDHIRAANGKPVEHVNFYRLLTGARRTVLTVTHGNDFDDTRDVEIELTGDGPLRQIQYQAWEGTCQKRVAEAEGDLGYIHLTGMNPENLRKIQQYLTGPGQNKKGLVLDVRNNGGGHLHNQLMDIFNREPFGQYRPRNGKEAFEPGLTWTKPVVLMINERSFSDAEVFPAAFRAVNRGPIVGRRTPGGVIGTRDITLSDGSRLRVPTVGWYRMSGENMEGNGVKPDHDIPLTFEDELANRDPQLAKAIELLQELVKAADATDAGTRDDGARNGGGGGEGSQD